MAIYRPRTIGDAPEGPERSGGCRRSDFLASRGMGEAQGKKVATTALRLRRSRRSRSSARSSHHRGPVRRVLNHKSGRRRWPGLVRLGKKSVRFGVGKETKGSKSGNRQRKASRKRPAPGRIDLHRTQLTLPHRSTLKNVATISLSLADPIFAPPIQPDSWREGWRRIISDALRPFGCVADRPRPADRHRGRGGRGLETQNRRSDMATIGS